MEPRQPPKPQPHPSRARDQQSEATDGAWDATLYSSKEANWEWMVITNLPFSISISSSNHRINPPKPPNHLPSLSAVPI